MAQISKRNVKSIIKMNNITKQKSLLQGSVNNFSNKHQNLPMEDLNRKNSKNKILLIISTFKRKHGKNLAKSKMINSF